jgi:hypothetical protein
MSAFRKLSQWLGELMARICRNQNNANRECERNIETIEITQRCLCKNNVNEICPYVERCFSTIQGIPCVCGKSCD